MATLTKAEALSLMNKKAQLIWAVISLVYGLVSGGLIFLLLKFGPEFSYEWTFFWSVLIILGVTVLVFLGLEKKDIIVPPGTMGVIMHEGDIISDEIGPSKIPIVSRIFVPFIGRRPKYEIEPVPTKDITLPVEIEGITTFEDNIRVGVIADLYFCIPNEVGFRRNYVENKMANLNKPENSKLDISSEGKIISILQTGGKKVADFYTYDELDDSRPSAKLNAIAIQARSNTSLTVRERRRLESYENKTFSDALKIYLENLGAEHGVTCNRCRDGSIEIAELGIKIKKILPKTTLAINNAVTEAREKRTIEAGEQPAQIIQAVTALKVARMLRRGVYVDEQQNFSEVALFAPGEHNIYANMSDKDLNAIAERHVDKRDPQEFLVDASEGLVAAIARAIAGGGGTP